MIKYLILSNILLLSTFARGQKFEIQIKQGAELPKISATADGNIEFIYNNNKIGLISKTTDVTKFHNVSTELSSNTCVTTTNMANCSFKVNYILENVSIGWLSHTIQEKVNRPILNDVDQGDSWPIFEAYNFWAWDNFGDNSISGFKYKATEIWNKISKPELTCSDFNWLPDISEQINIYEWSTEINTQNSETGKNENRAANVLFNVQGKKTNQKISFDGYESLAVNNNVINILTFILGDVLNWTLRHDNNFCQITFKANSSLLLNSLSNEFSDLSNYDYGFKPLNIQMSVREFADQIIRSKNSDNSYEFKTITDNKKNILKNYNSQFFDELVILSYLQLIVINQISNSEGSTILEIEPNKEIQ